MKVCITIITTDTPTHAWARCDIVKLPMPSNKPTTSVTRVGVIALHSLPYYTKNDVIFIFIINMRQHNVSLLFSVLTHLTVIINCETFYVLLSAGSASNYKAGKVDSCVGHIPVSMITPHCQTQCGHCFTATWCIHT